MRDFQQEASGYNFAEFSTQPPLSFDFAKRRTAKPPRFKRRFYQVTPDLLTAEPSAPDSDITSMILDQSKSKPKTVAVDTSVLDNFETASRRSLLALNHLEWFARGIRKSFDVLLDDTLSDPDRRKASEFADRLRDSIGLCLESTVRNQAYTLGTITHLKREAFLSQNSSSFHHSVTPWLLNQPVLNGKSLFGPVSDKIRPVIKDSREMTISTSVVKALQAKQPSSSGGKNQSSANRSSSYSSKSRKSKPAQPSASKPDFSAQTYHKGNQRGRRPYKQAGYKPAKRNQK